jgi:hypothetical protein
VPSLNGLPPNQVFLAFGIIFGFIILYAIIGRRYKPKIRADRIPKDKMPPPTDVDGWRIGTSIYLNKCPDCGQEDFFEGTREGQTVNVFCANRECRHGFNVWNFGDGAVWAKRIDNGPNRYY